MRLLLTLFFITLSGVAAAAPSDAEWVEARIKAGEGITTLLDKYSIPATTASIKLFKTINTRFAEGDGLLIGKLYRLPIYIVRYNGRNIRESVGGITLEEARRIEKYNKLMLSKGLQKSSYRESGIIWVPAHFGIIPQKPAQEQESENEEDNRETAEKNRDDGPVSSKNLRPLSSAIFGSSGSPGRIDNKLHNCVYYLDPGHGGPDPGAVGYKNGHELHEDEYAYDVTLRLAKELMRHGATVYMLVQDPGDGVRDDAYLSNSDNEVFMDGTAIGSDNVARLEKRAELVNRLYSKNRKRARRQRLIVIHVDSRVNDQRIDIFFYHKPGNEPGRKFASTLLHTIRKKYDNAQPGRGYEGTCSARNLFMLRNTQPISAYIELGNIQNPKDQVRLIERDNRQAIANWLCQGALEECSQR